ncbi:hypothetical protein SBD_2822 [Streptomyces bottropensis ATCC 25435]|uniref:Uncharacterized protein n=1 Tax=Streptomyces bottropensis ATCC 25435 TaxID=1054862 RepID=M3FTD7_9ACTN|nr:hypothetical protein SBD_2822 [Streptomyces bottropensis ATCC 25435]
MCEAEPRQPGHGSGSLFRGVSRGRTPVPHAAGSPHVSPV